MVIVSGQNLRTVDLTLLGHHNFHGLLNYVNDLNEVKRLDKDPFTIRRLSKLHNKPYRRKA